MKPGVSIIICCYNSAKRLPETLRHLALQEVPAHIPWEIIVVNNASTDDTAQVVEQEWASYNLLLPFRIVDQPNPGLSNARDKGFEVAAYEYCLFCDDDNWLQKDYVRLAFETMESDPMIGAAGGHGEPVFEGGKPDWFKHGVWGYAIGEQMSESGYVGLNRGYLYGAGLIINKTNWNVSKKLLNGFLSSDRKGNELLSGGDTELCYILSLNKFKLFYNSGLKFKHFIEADRLTLKYYRKLCFGFGRTQAILMPYKYLMANSKLTSPIWIKDILVKLSNVPQIIPRSKIERISELCALKGFVWEAIKRNVKYDRAIMRGIKSF